MDCPLYLVTHPDYCETPLPGALSWLEVPAEPVFPFETTSVETALDEPSTERVVLGFPKPDAELMDILLGEGAYSMVAEPIGILCEVIDTDTSDTGSLLVLMKGIARVHVSFDDSLPQLWCRATFVNEGLSADEMILSNEIQTIVNILSKHPHIFSEKFTSSLIEAGSSINKMDLLANYVFPTKSQQRRQYLAEEDNFVRWTAVTQAIHQKLRDKISENRTRKTRANARKRRKSKEQAVVEDWRTEGLSYKQRLDLLPADRETKKKIERRIKKLNNMPSSSTEHGVISDWLDCVFGLPWGVTSGTDFELKSLRDSMDETHYGLTDVKDTIIEHMCIERLKGGSMGSVLCFAGPPGTGKTSIAKTIARASGRPFQTIALGGLSDEAELRGHRSTYVGALPGRFISALRAAESSTPLILLDEIDKLGKGRGDPAAALLEILDPEQNSAFVDRYLALPFDLSKVLFICTANYINQIPEPLLDRIELIEFREYNFDERQHILREFLLPKCLEDYNMQDSPVEWTEEVLDELAKTTQIRKLEQGVRALLRKYAVRIHVYEEGPQVSSLNDLSSSSLTTKRKVGF